MKNFTFNKEEHYYELDGKRLYGVTTVLGVIAKPALIPWAAGMACDYINDNAVADDNGKIVFTEQELQDILQKAKVAHRKKKEDAGTKGTDTHSIVELLIKDAIDNNNGVIFGQSDNEQVKHFIDWAVKHKIKFLASEKIGRAHV